MKRKLHNVFLLLFSLVVGSLSAQDYWSSTTFKNGTQDVSLEKLDAKNYEVFQLNIEELKQGLIGAPLRSESNGKSNTIVSFPNEDGKISQYRIVEISIFSDPEYAAIAHPNIKTYLGASVDESGERVRFSITPLGLNAMFSIPGEDTVFIQPVTKVSNGQYLIYNREARLDYTEDFECSTIGEVVERQTSSLASKDANDQLLRTFRMAMSVTSEYTNFWDDGNAGNGDAQADALAQMISTLNRNNEVFEVDMAITFLLVDTADDPALDLIYSGTDPYGGNLNGDLQTNLTATVGEADYDIGHLLAFQGNNGNAGCIGCVCTNGKGSGFSAHMFVDNDGGPYMADFFDIDYVPHEIGHQMGANHTFSNSSEGAGVNAEPGSGTTIMGYAGITGGNDVQDHSDPYFHYYSITQILNNVTTGANTCAVTTAITNAPPVSNAGNDYTIPMGTAFILKGAATDPDGGDVLTYTWEQIDDGVTTNGNFGPTKTTGAVWRSRPPSTNPNRYMPILERVLNGQLTETNPVETVANTSWETVSTVARDLNFALTIRDRSEANGLGQMPQSDFDEMLVTVDGASGPFVVTSQTTNEIWDAGSSQTITWDVAGTDTGAVNTPTVNIILSTDGGLTFPFTLATDVPNDGSQDVNVPVIGGDSSMVRVIVEGNSNLFYAVNSTNFTIQESEFVISVANTTVDVCSPDDAVYNCTYNTFLGFTDTTNFSVTGLPVGATAVINPTSASVDGTAFTVTVSGTGTLALGSYPFTLEGVSGAITKSVNLTLNVFNGTVNTVTLVSPADTATGVAVNGALTWDADANAEDYFVEVASDIGFATIVESGTVQIASYTTTMLTDDTQYFWRVTASNQCATAAASSIFSFTTAAIVCSTFDSTENNITIPSTGATEHIITSTIAVGSNMTISDVNVTINVQHVWAGDIELKLTSPDGTEVIVLANSKCDDGTDDIGVTYDDQAAGPVVCSTVAPSVGGVIQPENPLSVFNGENAQGDWILTATDGFPAEDGGEFLNYSIEICGTAPLSVEEFDLTDALSLWPNPTSGDINLSFNTKNNEDVNVKLYDLRGRLISSQSFNNTANGVFNKNIQFGQLDAAVYILSIENAGQKINKRIIVK